MATPYWLFPVGYLLITSRAVPVMAEAEGQGGNELGSGHPQKTIQSPDRQYEAPKHYTKPQKTIQSPNTLYKDPKHYTKPSTY